MLGTHVCIYTGADPEGGAAGARPLLFEPNSLKSPLNWLKFVKKACVDEPPNPLRPLLFQILDPPLIHDICKMKKNIYLCQVCCQHQQHLHCKHCTKNMGSCGKVENVTCNIIPAR